MKILLIDDEEDIRIITRFSLGRIGGMEVVEAGSGAEGLKKAEAEQPDAILLDIMMPSMDGIMTLASLRRNKSTSRIPVIFLTAKALVNEVEQLKGLGAAGVLTKPFDPMVLADQVKVLLKEVKDDA